MVEAANQTAKWVSRRWWDRQFELVGSDGDKLAAMSVRGSSATANIGDREYRIKRLRREPNDSEEGAITIREVHSEKVAARFTLAGTRGALIAELLGGESFRLVCVRWWQGEWVWTDANSDVVLSTKKQWAVLELRPAPRVDPSKWLMLSLLHLALREVSRPWF